ncbi:MAG: PepSY domain-containing protein [Alphaproteobacteria bacterium]|nr:PepSY domain-containing protein [Alphaproteobacteria bacterium]MDE1931359.1 PepSY domain-containing protein [Alphaproteobacteria bacterium]
MKVSVPLAAVAALFVSSAAFAAGPAPASATQPAATPPSSAVKPAKSHVAAIRHHAKPMADAADMTTALNLLEAQGYYGFTDFQRSGQNYTATVTQKGKTFQVTVDPRTRQVTRG